MFYSYYLNLFPRFQLPEYILDFGFVIPGKVVSRAVKVSNNGSIPVSFHPTNKHLGDTGNAMSSYFFRSSSLSLSLSVTLIYKNKRKINLISDNSRTKMR